MAKISTHCDFNKTPAVIVARYTLHEACKAWPPMSDAELAALRDDIRINGQHEPIALTPAGLLIDGQNRVLACKRVDVKPTTFVFEGDPWIYSISKNARRRHMSVDRIAMTVATLATRGEGGDQYVGKTTGSNEPVVSDRGLSVAQVAKAAGVPETAIKSAKVVLRHGAPGEIEAVTAGKIPLRQMADRVRDRKRASPPVLRLVGVEAKSVGVPGKVIALNDPNRVTKALIAKCADGEWRTLDKFAGRVDAASSVVREKLKLLRAETHRGADGGLEYRLTGERRELLARAGLAESPCAESPCDEPRWRGLLAAKDDKIRHLKQLLRKKTSELAELRAGLLSTASHVPVLQ
jgi:hypothetical protein